MHPEVSIRYIDLDSTPKSEWPRLIKRSELDIDRVKSEVARYIDDVRSRGDKAIVEFYEKFFGKKALTGDMLRVSKEEFDEAYKLVDPGFVEAVEVARRNIEAFHRAQLPRDLWLVETSRGVFVGQMWRPLDSVGLYIPGGRACYPSTALMLAIPARVAGVPRIVAVTPPRSDGSVDPHVLVALDIAGVREVYRVGGAHAVAALAYGTESIPRVEKILGPGNIWVNAAKALLRDVIDIDFIAGPSEVLLLILDHVDPEIVFYDMAAQAEHDPLSAVAVVTTSAELAEELVRLIRTRVHSIDRSEIVMSSLSSYGLIAFTRSVETAVEFVNSYAPEHLEILASDLDRCFATLQKIRSAGSVFLGVTSPVAIGDYVSGANHVLPTGGYARRRGGLSILDFIKIIDVQLITPTGIRSVGPHAIKLAIAEGLKNHAKSIELRLARLGTTESG